jgi:hypothetical protein
MAIPREESRGQLEAARKIMLQAISHLDMDQPSRRRNDAIATLRREFYRIERKLERGRC